jgi:S-adenosyl-L-methionine hydrolase (adenosine-forming)
MGNLITLTTDFGWSDGFAGILHGVILNIAPHACVVDISHGVEPQNVMQAALLLADSVSYFPRASIHVSVVDPGVGSSRKALAVAVGETIFVAPDNGVASLAIAQLQSLTGSAPHAFELDNPAYWLPRVSTTFHGRDIFAPCAAHLANGIALHELGTPVESFVTLATLAPERRADGALAGQVQYIDRFGNLITNIQAEQLAAFSSTGLLVEINGHTLHGIRRAYAEVPPGQLLALVSSSWRLEIAVRNGNAASAVGGKVGDPVVVRESEEAMGR